MIAKVGTASAADDDPVLVGNPDNTTADGATVITNTNNTASTPGTPGQEGISVVLTGADNGSHAVKGVTSGLGHSIAGDTPAGDNVVAATWGRHGGAGAGIGGVSAMGYGGEFVGGKSHVRLIQVDNENLGTGETAVSGPPTDDAHLIGELFADGDGNLYYNQGAGSNFTRLTNQTVILSDTQRAYDSREEYTTPANTNKGRHGAGEVRSIDLTEFTDVPATASGAIINLTVAETDALGFALVYNGDSTSTPVGSSINWVDAGEFIANGITVAVSSTGTVNVYTLTETEIIIDVVGYLS